HHGLRDAARRSAEDRRNPERSEERREPAGRERSRGESREVRAHGARATAGSDHGALGREDRNDARGGPVSDEIKTLLGDGADVAGAVTRFAPPVEESPTVLVTDRWTKRAGARLTDAWKEA